MNWAALLAAIMMVESGGEIDQANARGDFVNGVPRSIGALQIQKAVVDDCLRVYPGCGFTYEDRTNIKKSKSIARHYLVYWGNKYQERTGKPATVEVLARIWNGGPRGYEKQATLKYWEKIKKELGTN